MSDILTHIEGYERFRGVGATASQSSGTPSRTVAKPTGRNTPAERSAILNQLGVAPTRATQRARANGLPIPSAANFSLYSIDHSQLEASLLKVQTYDALMALIENASRMGVFRLDGSKILLQAQSETSAATPLSYDITETVKRAALALKASEAGPLLQRLNGQSGDNVINKIVGQSALPQLVQVTDTPGQPTSLVREGSGSALSGFRQKLAEFIRPHDILATGAELGANAVMMVVGEPIRLSDGQYLPVEAVESEAQALLTERLSRTGSPGKVALMRMDQLQPMPVPKVFSDAPAMTSDGEQTLPSSSRIELAYRLIKGISLDDQAGEPLEASMRMQLEGTIGSDFSHVRLHTGPVAQWITDALSARAITSDKHVFIPKDQVTDQTGRGSQTLMHELVHVKQATEGETSRPRAELEAEARMAETVTPGEAAMSFATKSQPILPTPSTTPEEGVFMAHKEQHGTRAQKKESRHKVQLLEEETLSKLEQQFHLERQKMKEELRDRVF